MDEIKKIANILNDCLDNLNAVKVSGTLNCGRIWSTDQSIRYVLNLIYELNKKATEEIKTEGENADKSDEIQS